MSLELLQIAEAVSREKDIEKEQILTVMEQAMQMAARRKYGMDLNIKATLDRVTGDVGLQKLVEVVNIVMEPLSIEEVRAANRENREPEMRPSCDKKGYPLKQNASQILLAEAQKQNPDIKVGEFLTEDLPPIDFGRVAAQAAKQVIFQKVKDVERAKEFEEYKESIGQFVSGLVKKADYNGVILDLGRAEAFIPREEMIPRETYRQGDRVRGYIYKVEQSPRGPQIWVSRTHPQYLLELFREAVPEVENGSIELMGAARDPGFRAKMAVKSMDRNMDPVGACVGVRGVRVQQVTQELQGERVDIIEWSPNPAEFLIRAMQPAVVTKVVMDEADNRMEVAVPEDNLSLAIGRRGQNVRLASILTGWDIDVMTEAEESERRSQEVKLFTTNFMENLDVDETLAHLLVAEGFQSVDDLLKVDTFELAQIDGIDEAIAGELQNRAQASIDAANTEFEKLGLSDDLKAMAGMNADMLKVLGQNDIKTKDDLGDLATDELQEMLPAGMLNDKQAERLIMAARASWFAEEDDDAENEDEDDTAEEAAVAATETAETKAEATA